MMDSVQEKELIEKAGTDGDAFGLLYDEYYPQIFGYTLKRTADLPATQDITSEVFIKALSNIKRFHWRNIPFSAWLYRIANNEIINHYRKNGNGHLDPERLPQNSTPTEPSPAVGLEQAEEELLRYQDFLQLHHHIAQLSEKYQEVIILRYFERKKICEIADILGKREGTVKSLLHRGLEKLRVRMEEYA